jgi:PTH1 family peptidyl-tRNA hydrolase
MNISGRFVARAWSDMVKQQDPSSLSLIIVHDELEAKKGTVSLRAWDRSPRGHNGVKDVKNKLSQDKYPTSPFVRIAVGIGRPSDGERDRGTVSDYVLERISNEERRVFEEDEVPRRVAEQLIQVEKEWKAELER